LIPSSPSGVALHDDVEMRPPAYQERIDSRVAFPDPLAVYELRHESGAQTEVRAEAEREAG
jgi:hypothetical protein